MIGEGENAPAFAEHWASQLGGSVDSLERLRGGINNRVFRCSDGDQHWVIKGYAPAQPGQRDRMQAEVDFLRFAAQAAPGFTPSLIEIDDARRCVVMEHIYGKSYTDGAYPPRKDVDAAIKFFMQINTQSALAKSMIRMDAAEGFLGLRQHMGNVRERLAIMGTEHLISELKCQAKKLLYQLKDYADRVEGKLEAQISSGAIEDELNPDYRCISPSDFGFHNAIRTAKGVKFIDFEFSGWDDPTKTAADFKMQPRVPVNPLHIDFHHFIDKRLVQKLKTRHECIKPIIQLKWLCIIAAVLNPCRIYSILQIVPDYSDSAFIKNRILLVTNLCSKYNY